MKTSKKVAIVAAVQKGNIALANEMLSDEPPEAVKKFLEAMETILPSAMQVTIDLPEGRIVARKANAHGTRRVRKKTMVTAKKQKKTENEFVKELRGIAKELRGEKLPSPKARKLAKFLTNLGEEYFKEYPQRELVIEIQKQGIPKQFIPDIIKQFRDFQDKRINYGELEDFITFILQGKGYTGDY